MSYYEKNLEIIRVRAPYIYESILKYQPCLYKREIDGMGVITARDGNKILEVTKEQKTYRLNSLYQPVSEAKRWSNQYQFDNYNQRIFLFGLGNGMFASSIVERLKKDDILIIYEPKIELFLFLLEQFDYTDLLNNKQICFFVGDISEQQFKSLLIRVVEWMSLPSQLMLLHPQYDQVFPLEYLSYLKEIKKADELAHTEYNTQVRFQHAWVEYLLKNLNYFEGASIDCNLKNLFPNNIPAIIVSAGPSLDKNINYLKEAKGYSVIFAVDRALQSLMSHGIKPDFIVTIHTGLPEDEFYVGEEVIDIPLIIKTEATTEILESHKGIKILTFMHPFIKKFLIQQNIDFQELDGGGSVATTAFSICINAGFKHIILVGQDLAYEGDLTHTGGVSDFGVSLNNEKTMYVDDIYGNPIKTRADWYNYLQWFSRMIAENVGFEAVDATEGGAKIEGTKIMTLQEAIQLYCKDYVDCKKIVEDIHPTFDSETMDAFLTYLREAITDINQIYVQAKKAINLCTKLLKDVGYQSKEEHKRAKELSKINKIIEAKPVYMLIDEFMRIGSANIFSAGKDNIENKKGTYSKGKEIYELVIEAIDNIEPYLKNAYEEMLQNRRTEEC